MIATAGFTEEIDDRLLAKGVLKLFTVDQCDLILSTEREWFSSSGSFQPSALMRYQANHQLPVVNRWHETVELGTDQRLFLAGHELAVDEEALRRTGLLF